MDIIAPKKYPSIVVCSDIHYPHQNGKSLSRLESLLQGGQPDIFVIAGDLIDFGPISKFPKIPGQATLKEEINGVKDLLKGFRAIIPKSKIVYVFGNHEFRLRQYLMRQAPELWELMNLEDLLELKKLKIDFAATKPDASKFVDTFIKIGDWVIGHADKALQEPGMSAKWLMTNRFNQNSVIQGHCHKAALMVKKNLNGSLRFGIECGCLCETESGYSSDRNWVNSAVIIKDNKPYLEFL